MVLIFTDLDGTLLDHDTYSWEPAKPAIHRLLEKKIPWIFVTSKTRAETEAWRTRAGNQHPFIVENGGAAFVPVGYFPTPVAGATRRDPFEILEFGTPYVKLATELHVASERSRCRIRSFSEMSVEEVARVCGLPIDLAHLAKQREYDEPFIIIDKDRESALIEAIEARGLRCTRGGRFRHITGANEGRSTWVRTNDNLIIIVPNAEFTNATSYQMDRQLPEGEVFLPRGRRAGATSARLALAAKDLSASIEAIVPVEPARTSPWGGRVLLTVTDADASATGMSRIDLVAQRIRIIQSAVTEIRAEFSSRSLLEGSRPADFRCLANFPHPQINAYTSEASRMAVTCAELHQHIQNCFNESGVEIMLPHYGSLRDGNQITIPRQHLSKGYSPPSFRFEQTRHERGPQETGLGSSDGTVP